MVKGVAARKRSLATSLGLLPSVHSMRLRPRPSTPGTFGLLPLEIVLMILGRLDVGDLVRVELSSSYFRRVALEGWRKRAEFRAKTEEVRLKIMEKDLEDLEKSNVTLLEEWEEIKKYLYQMEKMEKIELLLLAGNWKKLVKVVK